VATHQRRKDVVFWDLIAVIDPFSQTDRALPSESEFIDRLKCIHRPVLKIGTSRRYCERVEALKNLLGVVYLEKLDVTVVNPGMTRHFFFGWFELNIVS
jgi:hypothetical protein